FFIAPVPKTAHLRRYHSHARLKMIRKGQVSDIHDIARVHVSSWRTTYIGQVPQSYLDQLSVGERESAWTKVFADPKNQMLVAEEKGRMVGFSSFGPSREDDANVNVGELYSIYLLEECKGQGIGTS